MGALKIESTSHDGYHLIKVPNLPGRDQLEALDKSVEEWLKLPDAIHVLDFQNVMALDQPLLVKITQFQKSLKKISKQLFSVNVSSAIEALMKERGLHATFAVKASLADIKAKATPAKGPAKLDAAVLQPFIDAALKAFEVQVNMKIHVGKMSSKKQLFEPNDCVVGTISVDITGFKGQISLCFEEKVFLAVYKALLGEELKQVDAESADAAGELTNMIYGHAKTALNKMLGIALQPVLPVITLHPKVTDSTSPVIVLPFESEAGPFRIEIVVL